MAALSEQDRADLWRDFQRRNDDPFGDMTKTELRTAVDQIDAWFDTNKASLIAAVTGNPATALSGGQIAQIASAIVEKRWKTGA